jgi:hypothetical protein
VSGRTTWTYIGAQFIAYLLFATVLFLSYARINARFDQEARAQDARIERVLTQTRQLVVGLSQYIECIADRARSLDPSHPITDCELYLGGG